MDDPIRVADAALNRAFDPILELFFIAAAEDPVDDLQILAWLDENELRFFGVFIDMERYIVLAQQHEMPEALRHKFHVLKGMLEWLMHMPQEEYDEHLFGPDVEKRGYTEEEIIAHSVLQEFGRAKLAFEQPQCTICLQEFSKADTVRKLNCQHVFHGPCLDTWLATRKTCPICVKDVLASPPAFVNVSSRSQAPALDDKKRGRREPIGANAVRRQSKRVRGIPPE